nr:N-acetyltransferase [Sneathiella chinensis]
MFVDRERLDHVRELYTHRLENSYYVHALSVDDSLQGQGAGRALLDLAYEIAQDEGFDSVSLHVWRDNERAFDLYQKNGFKPVTDIRIDRHDRLPHDGGMILMKHELG